MTNGTSSLSNIAALGILIFCASAIGADCKKDIRNLVSARNVFILTVSVWFLMEAFLVPDALLGFTQAAYNFGLLCVSLCLIGFLSCYHSCRGGVFDGLFRRLGYTGSTRMLWNLFIAACIIGFLPLFWVTKGNPIPILEDAFMPRARWSSVFARGRYGGVRDAFLELQMFLRAAVPFGAAILVSKNQPTARRMVVAFFLAYSFGRAFNSGTRSRVAEVFLPIAAGVYWRLSPTLKRSALLFGVPTLFVIGLTWSAASVVTRNAGDFDWSAASRAKYVGFEMFRELLFITDAVPEHSDFKYGRTYFVQLVNPIPRAIWPGKPDDDAGLELARLQGMVSGGRAFMTVAPGLIGEMYWNGGVVAVVLISAFLGYLAKSWDRTRPVTNQSALAFTVFAAGLAAVFVSGRSINMKTMYGLLALMVLIYAFGKTKGSRRAASAPLGQ